MNGPDLEKPYQDTGDFSEAANAAFATLENLKKAIEDCQWISGNEKSHTSYGVNIRWERMQSLIALIRQPIEKYSPTLLAGIEEALKSELDEMDTFNVDYDPLAMEDDDPQEHFGYYLKQYAEAIIEALKTEMRQDSWGDAVEADQFENNR
jgi:hypothetical protein